MAGGSVTPAFHGVMTITGLSVSDLVEWTTDIAQEVRAGLHTVHADASDRWHTRLLRDDTVDVWLISWTPSQGAQLHDHGGSRGAFTVVEGTLTESAWDPTQDAIAERERHAGDSVAFGDSYIHDVRNVRDATAVSVHAYSPPLTLMRYYDLVDGTIVPLAELWTEDPEAPAPNLRAAS